MERPATCRWIPRASGAGAPGAGRRWTQFLAGLLGILLFAFVAVPGLQRLGPVREVREAIENSGIDATALFYTESDVSSEAETSIRNALRYSPQGAAHPATGLTNPPCNDEPL